MAEVVGSIPIPSSFDAFGHTDSQCSIDCAFGNNSWRCTTVNGMCDFAAEELLTVEVTPLSVGSGGFLQRNCGLL